MVIESADGNEYRVEEITTNNQLVIIKTYIPTQEEIAEQQKQSRITELKLLITNKKLLDMDCTEEQAELKLLLGL